MANVHDVAQYIVSRQGAMTTMKLQKLAYYSQAWHLVWDGEPLFDAPIQAWMNGPVVRELYQRHRGQFHIAQWPLGDSARLSRSERETVDAVLEAYGHLTPQQLSDLTHSERPWQEAREGLSPTDRSERPISLDTMQEFYDALAHAEPGP
ncbi:MAG TPA: type II toxin-antitoxin system antitoxin SocA domain-containing protein [Actinomycetales bacterium]|jgi:uncharacterized phage-associated protein|nr:type II toxin-antitoxin system antitoxin SocA domain-containing protein [Actinomycetales bacterium]